MTDIDPSTIGANAPHLRDTGYDDQEFDAVEDCQDEFKSMKSRLSGRAGKLYGQACNIAAAGAINEVTRRMETYLPFCESELEKTFLAALVTEAHYDNQICFPHRENFRGADWASRLFGDGFENFLHRAIRDHGPTPTIVLMQVPIAEYRVDFLLYGISASCDDRSTWGHFKLVVECDGHDFHEKTKAQAARDKQRDRKLMSMGYHIMRFTGSEMWKNPQQCVHEATGFVGRLLSHHYGRSLRGGLV